MKMMKKFSLLVALALIVTIGGVYATWNYADASNAKGMETNLRIDLASAVIGGGTLTRHSDSALSIVIDDNDNNHIADDLTFNGGLILIFKSDAGSTDSGLDSLKYKASFAAVPAKADVLWEYNGRSIFTVENTEVELEFKRIQSTTEVGGYDLGAEAGYYYTVLEPDHVQSIIKLTENVQLDSVAEWNAFDAALRLGNIEVTFSPVTVDP